MVVYIIAAAAGIGSLVGVFFQVRIMALLWATPVLCFLYGASVFIAPHVQANEAAPEGLRAVLAQLTDLSLFVPMLIAGAAGALFASSLTRYAQSDAAPGSRGRVSVRRIEQVRSGVARDRLKDRTEHLSRDRIDLGRNAATPLPVYEVAYEPPPAAEPVVDLAADAQPRLARPAPPASDANRRRQGRRRSALAGELVFDDGVCMGCTIQDLSVGGARVRLMAPWPEPRLRTLRDLTHGIAHDVVLRWRAGPIAGLRFTASYQLEAGAAGDPGLPGAEKDPSALP